ncbi:hypothetical protein CJF42_24310, partial [Pseudoalteromonas sp. NBT06-2]|uniref:replication initiation factor domain-containing protein n=1 Tax=Pseudoalteromonas sp. NBT06-2 TaxID=2025950 RepID=UPI000BC869CE
GLFTYEKSATLYRHGVDSGRIAWGANNGGCMVSFTGTGCSGLDIPKLHGMLKKMPNVKLTRLDVAYDDLEGVRDIKHYIQELEKGAFCKTNAMPGYSLIQSGRLQKLSAEEKAEYKKKHGWQKQYELIPDAGCTLYVGSRNNGKLARMYEKGKQLDSQTQNGWVRAELELRAIDREIDVDCLINLDGVFASGYPAFEFASDYRCDVPTNTRVKVVMDTNARLLKYNKLSYGKHINFMRHILELSDTEIINELTKGLSIDDMPDSIKQVAVQPPNFNESVTQPEYIQ